MEPAGLEQILQELLLPDTDRIRRATEQLQTALRDPTALPALCDLLTSAGDPQIRQFAAVLTRRRLSTGWRRLVVEQRESLKSLILSALQRETEWGFCC
uniref:Importin 4 n=2 Tax=Sus scrofa TaxID=9823 RepID=A0A4X1SQC5_PIG